MRPSPLEVERVHLSSKASTLLVWGGTVKTAFLVTCLFFLSATCNVAGFASKSSAPVRIQVVADRPFGTEWIPDQTLNQYSDLAVKWLRDYLRINTTNPPGNEQKSAEFFKALFDAEGIENQLLEFAPGRANIWAHMPCALPSKECGRPIILLNHMDVVTAEASHWRVPPFSAAIVGGSIYGRGAQDMKKEGIVQALVLVMLSRERVQLSRDVIFLATADEEVDNVGSKWIIQNRRDLLRNAEYLITEGGENSLGNSGVEYVGIDVAEKAPFWLHVVAHGHAGHGSQPSDDSAPDRLIAALQKITDFRPELRLTPVVEAYLRAMAPLQSQTRAQQFLNIRYMLQDQQTREQFRADGSLGYMLQDTLAVTMLGGASQTNVIPDEAWANVDVRLLPGSDPQQLLDNLRKAVNDPNVTIEPLKGFVRSNESPTNTELWDTIRAASKRYFDNAPLVPFLTTGYTESQLYRELGIVCYGFSPYRQNIEESGTEHGDNERVRVDEVRQAPRVLYDVVVRIAGGRPNF